MKIINLITDLNYTYLLDYKRYVEFQKKLRKNRFELILFCQHPETITAGNQSKNESLVVSKDDLINKNIEHVLIERGGDYTAHEPGQCVVYFHIDIKKRNLKLGNLISDILNITSDTINEIWEINSFVKLEKDAGVYVNLNNNLNIEKSKIKNDKIIKNEIIKNEANYKLVSLGLYFKSFFSSYGIAVNIDNDLKTFNNIIPCGNNNNKMISIKEIFKNKIKESNQIDFEDNKNLNQIKNILNQNKIKDKYKNFNYEKKSNSNEEKFLSNLEINKDFILKQKEKFIRLLIYKFKEFFCN